MCYTCNNTGWKVLHRAGDPVPGMATTYFASTTFVTCDCMIVKPAPFREISPPEGVQWTREVIP
jgi:hypothetical protein